MDSSDNSLAERLARVFKHKQYQETTFRSMEGLENVSIAKSTIDNVRSASSNVRGKLVEVFSQPTPELATASTEPGGEEPDEAAGGTLASRPAWRGYDIDIPPDADNRRQTRGSVARAAACRRPSRGTESGCAEVRQPVVWLGQTVNSNTLQPCCASLP